MRRQTHAKKAGEVSITSPVVTDATAPALLGMSSRQFRDTVTRQHIPFMKLGQRTVVFFSDLQVLAHRNPTVAGAHPEPRDMHNRKLAASTDVDDFWASVEHLDERDTVNAILRRVGHQLSDEAYRDFYKTPRREAAASSAVRRSGGGVKTDRQRQLEAADKYAALIESQGALIRERYEDARGDIIIVHDTNGGSSPLRCACCGKRHAPSRKKTKS